MNDAKYIESLALTRHLKQAQGHVSPVHPPYTRVTAETIISPRVPRRSMCATDLDLDVEHRLGIDLET
jgi:hypothetical protein